MINYYFVSFYRCLIVDLSVHDFPHIWVMFLNPGNGRFQFIPSRMTPLPVFWTIIPIEMHGCTDH